MTPSEALDWRLALGSISIEEYKKVSASLPRPSSFPNPILDERHVAPRDVTVDLGRAEKNGERILLSREEIELHLQIYTIFREYVKHEDSLINWRLSWNFAIQGFLFAAYALATQKVFESNSVWGAQTPDLHAIDHFVILLAVVGLSVTFIISFGVNAATIAITELDERWRSVHELYAPKLPVAPVDGDEPVSRIKKTHGPTPPGLPGIVGGGIYLYGRGMGILSARLLPWVFVVAWVVVLLMWFRR